MSEPRGAEAVEAEDDNESPMTGPGLYLEGRWVAVEGVRPVRKDLILIRWVTDMEAGNTNRISKGADTNQSH